MKYIKFIKNIEAKAKPISIIFLLLMATISTFIFISPSVGADYTDFSNRKLITIDHTKVANTLSNFPVWVHNTSDDFKDSNNGGVIQPDGDDIAFYSYDNNTQYNHEIELYNGTSGEIGIWVNVTSIPSGSVSYFWIYYGDADGNNQQDRDGTWDLSRYVLVNHMNGSNYAECIDSTANDHALEGESGNPAYNSNGQLGDGVYFTSDNWTYPDHADFVFGDGSDDSPFSVMVWGNVEDINTFDIFYKNNGDYDREYATYGHTDKLCFTIYDDTKTVYESCTTDDAQEYENDWAMVTWTYDGVGGTSANNGMDIWVNNGSAEDANTADSGSYDSMHDENCKLNVGGSQVSEGTIEGYYDELRLYKVDLNQSYIDATYFSHTDQLLTFGPEDEGPGSSSSFSFDGLDGNNRITFNATAGNLTWSNATSGPGGTLEIIYNISAGDNCTEMRLNLTHISQVQGILCTNVSVTFDDNNDSWSTNTVAYSGTNVTINESVWDAESWCTGTNPFPIDGAGWTNGSIYARFTLDIDADASVGTYTVDTWKMWFKVLS